MTNSDEEKPDAGITDEQLPPDLVPSDDNPLAEPLDDDVEVDLDEGKSVDEIETEGPADSPESDESDESDESQDT